MATPDPTSVLASITDSKQQLSEVLAGVTPDDVLISGILNFIRSKFLTLIIKDVNDSIRKSAESSNDSSFPLAQQANGTNAAETSEALIDRIWSDFYHPVFKYYQSLAQDLKHQETHQNKKRTVELRKLNDNFKKVAKLAADFYLDLLKHTLTHHNLRFIVPTSFYKFLNLGIEKNAISINKSDRVTIVKLIYMVHRSLLFLGSTSRYRSTISRFLPKADHEDFDRALQYCRYSELLLPAFGEARNHIGMVYNAQDDKLLAAYEFLRSALARTPSKLGSANFNVLINSTTQTIDDLNRLRLENNINNKNRQAYLSTYFLVLYGYYFNPSKWKRSEGVIINGTPLKDVKTDLFKLLTGIASKGQEIFMLQKLLILLIGGIALSGFSNSTALNPAEKETFKFTFEFIEIIERFFIEQWAFDKTKSLNLLPLLRFVLTWLRTEKTALQYAHRDLTFLKNTALLLNLLFKHVPDHDFQKVPERTQYFMEDVALREFTPINKLFRDFDDAAIFNSPDIFYKLLGEFGEHDAKEENLLRIYAVGYLGRKIINANRVGISFEIENNQFNVENAKEIKKTQIPGAQFKIQPKNQVSQSETATAKKNRRKRGANKRVKEQEQLEAQAQAQKAISSNSDSDGVVEISETAFNQKVDINENKEPSITKGLESISVSNNPTTSHQAVVSLEDLESKLTNARKDQNYATMVDSLVDDTFVSRSNNQTPNNENINSGWSSQGINQSPQPPQINNAFPQNLSGFNNFNNHAYQSPLPNTSPFPSYQNYYPIYQQQQNIPNPNPQSAQSNNMYHQYKDLYAQYQQPQVNPQQQQQTPLQPQQQYYDYSAYQQLYYAQQQAQQAYQQTPGTPNQK